MSSGSPHIKTKKGSAATCHPDASVFRFCRDGTCNSYYSKKGNFFPLFFFLLFLLFSELGNRSFQVPETSLKPAVARQHLMEGGGLLEKKGWSVGKSVPWPTTWMDSLSSSPEDEHCAKAVTVTTWRQSWQTSQPACHLLLERCGFIRWAHWGEAQLSGRILDVNVPQGRM